MPEPVVTYLLEKNYLLKEGLKNILADTHFKITELPLDIAGAEEINGSIANADLVLYGIDEGDNKSESIIGKLKKISPNGRITILSENMQPEFIASCFAQGIDGYLAKSMSPPSLLNSLNMIMAGEKIYPVAALNCFIKKSIYNTGKCGYNLSAREMEILRHVADGKTNKEIALYRDIAESTVKAHVKTILRKLNLSNRTQAARWAFSMGLINETFINSSVHIVNENRP